MSLINDALRRASKKDKEIPREAPVAGMEPVPPAKGSRTNSFVGILALVVLLLAGWYFWQWWTVRQKAAAAVAAKAAQLATPRALPTTTSATNTTPSIIFVHAKPPPAPAVAAAPPVTTTVTTAPPTTTDSTSAPPPAPAPAVAQAPVAPAPAPEPVDERISLPVDLTVSAILFNATDPHALINGQLYGNGDVIQGGVTVRKVEKNRVVFEWNGHTKILMVGE